MSWQINTSSMARIRSLEDAKRHWAKEKPWRNEPASWRPLDNRRKHHIRLVKLADNKGYECYLYTTPVVTYLTDGNVILRSYDSNSTQQYAWHVCPQGTSSVSHQGDMWWKIETPMGTEYHREGRNPITIAPMGNDKWQVISQLNPTTESTYMPKRGAEARKAIKAYADWYKLTMRVTGFKIPNYQTPCSLMYVTELVNNPSNTEFYPTLLEHGGHLATVREHAYRLFDVYIPLPVPYGRLPRKR